MTDLTGMQDCTGCNYKDINHDKDLYCYMFKEKPSDYCMKHTDIDLTMNDSVLSALTQNFTRVFGML